MTITFLLMRFENNSNTLIAFYYNNKKMKSMANYLIKGAHILAISHNIVIKVI